MKIRELLGDDSGPVVRDDDLRDGNGDIVLWQKWFVLKAGVLGGELVLVVSEEKYLEEARSKHPGLVVYFPREVKELLLRRTTPMFSRRVHMIKKVLDGVIVPWNRLG
ncbi:MAG: hypothetical protein KJ970_13865 [Candidatus Eisenbacteria bacterium]|uniref:Uncharacterized protein n=1 Tax=Eiseniibacteriota bacterium TaxID=2212470 RepID=A0A948W4A5_UNCEI|nr:hypothetical protein [Candidatus Eisenbacteria bacterium]MBU2692002.1 hypothetical protein [Candidatus Eisenbacteria bacterium]